ncbi:EspA/EspE family type VII secretion system effector [Mycolicibacterium holsaticum]|uniref:EspA/EspE family type VII secretion system effector n=1 Tax=Mycolicibacterium holsaticum TaxID=152142 RepID=UPI00197C0F4C|nr:EspA/EspE family type VII secretion system effector [Mycolicibacterium holsaticum]
MGAVDGFLATWSRARATFGEGNPQAGADFDASARLRSLQGDVESAAPASDWTGAAADTYADENLRQGRTLGAMADLDRRLAAEVDRSAAVVAAGRRDLDAVKQWVLDAAATAPSEQMTWPAVRKGVGDVAEIIERSHADLSAIAGRIRALGGEYAELGGDRTPVSLMGNGQDDKDVPETALDLADIVRLAPFDPNDESTYGPPGYKELVPGSGTWIPDPGSPLYRPSPPEAPLDLNDIVQLAPFDANDESTYGPPGYTELVPGSGTWIPDPGSPTFPKSPPEAPVDLNDIVDRGRGSLGQPWEIELIPGSGVWVPDPNYGNPR